MGILSSLGPKMAAPRIIESETEEGTPPSEGEVSTESIEELHPTAIEVLREINWEVSSENMFYRLGVGKFEGYEDLKELTLNDMKQFLIMYRLMEETRMLLKKLLHYLDQLDEKMQDYMDEAENAEDYEVEQEHIYNDIDTTNERMENLRTREAFMTNRLITVLGKINVHMERNKLQRTDYMFNTEEIEDLWEGQCLINMTRLFYAVRLVSQIIYSKDKCCSGKNLRYGYVLQTESPTTSIQAVFVVDVSRVSSEFVGIVPKDLVGVKCREKMRTSVHVWYTCNSCGKLYKVHQGVTEDTLRNLDEDLAKYLTEGFRLPSGRHVVARENLNVVLAKEILLSRSKGWAEVPSEGDYKMGVIGEIHTNAVCGMFDISDRLLHRKLPHPLAMYHRAYFRPEQFYDSQTFLRFTNKVVTDPMSRVGAHWVGMIMSPRWRNDDDLDPDATEHVHYLDRHPMEQSLVVRLHGLPSCMGKRCIDGHVQTNLEPDLQAQMEKFYKISCNYRMPKVLYKNNMCWGHIKIKILNSSPIIRGFWLIHPKITLKQYLSIRNHPVFIAVKQFVCPNDCEDTNLTHVLFTKDEEDLITYNPVFSKLETEYMEQACKGAVRNKTKVMLKAPRRQCTQAAIRLYCNQLGYITTVTNTRTVNEQDMKPLEKEPETKENDALTWREMGRAAVAIGEYGIFKTKDELLVSGLVGVEKLKELRLVDWTRPAVVTSPDLAKLHV